MKFIRIFLLVLIIIGLAALATQKLWVPKLVGKILAAETEKNQLAQSETKVTGSTSVTAEKSAPVDRKTGLSFEQAISSLNQGSDDVAYKGLTALVGGLADIDLNRAKNAVIDFVSNYTKHIQARPKTLLTALYFVKVNHEVGPKITEASNFLCSSEELKAETDIQGIFKQACANR